MNRRSNSNAFLSFLLYPSNSLSSTIAGGHSQSPAQGAKGWPWTAVTQEAKLTSSSVSSTFHPVRNPQGRVGRVLMQRLTAQGTTKPRCGDLKKRLRVSEGQGVGKPHLRAGPVLPQEDTRTRLPGSVPGERKATGLTSFFGRATIAGLPENTLGAPSARPLTSWSRQAEFPGTLGSGSGKAGPCTEKPQVPGSLNLGER
jgi:hypothetical protein